MSPGSDNSQSKGQVNQPGARQSNRTNGRGARRGPRPGPQRRGTNQHGNLPYLVRFGFYPVRENGQHALGYTWARFGGANETAHETDLHGFNYYVGLDTDSRMPRMVWFPSAFTRNRVKPLVHPRTGDPLPYGAGALNAHAMSILRSIYTSLSQRLPLDPNTIVAQIATETGRALSTLPLGLTASGDNEAAQGWEYRIAEPLKLDRPCYVPVDGLFELLLGHGQTTVALAYAPCLPADSEPLTLGQHVAALMDRYRQTAGRLPGLRGITNSHREWFTHAPDVKFLFVPGHDTLTNPSEVVAKLFPEHPSTIVDAALRRLLESNEQRDREHVSLTYGFIDGSREALADFGSCTYTNLVVTLDEPLQTQVKAALVAESAINVARNHANNRTQDKNIDTDPSTGSDAVSEKDTNARLCIEFTAALTVLASTMDHRSDGSGRVPQTVININRRINAMLTSWLTHRPLNLATDRFDRCNPLSKVDYERMLPRVEALLTYAPWLRWYIHERFKPIIHLTMGQVLDLLEVIAPRLTLDQTHNNAYRYRDGSSWTITRSFAITDLPDTNLYDLRNLEDPFIALHRGDHVQAHYSAANLPAPWADAVTARLPAIRQAGLSALRIDVDRTDRQTRLMLTNRSETELLDVTVDGTLIHLGTRATLNEVSRPDHRKGAPSSVAHAIDGHPKTVAIGHHGGIDVVPLPPKQPRQFPATGGTHTFDADYFVGRDGYIREIHAVTIDRPTNARRPVVIRGNRRSGKTSLAYHALLAAHRQGKIGTVVVWDVSKADSDPGRTGTSLVDTCLRALTRSCRRVKAPLPPPEAADAVDLIQLFDILSAWIEATDQLPLGIVLDEFDSLTGNPAAPQVVAEMLSELPTAAWDNVIPVMTVQRHSDIGEAKGWHQIIIPVLLTVEDMASFFAPHLLDPEPIPFELDTGGEASNLPDVHQSNRYLVDMKVFTFLRWRLSTRPYFWGEFLARIASTTSDDVRILTEDEADAATVAVIHHDPYLSAIFDEPREDEPDHLRLIRDYFTDDERAVLARFRERRVIQLDQVNDLYRTGVEDLCRREITSAKKNSLIINGTVWSKRVEFEWHLFERYLDYSSASEKDPGR